VLILSLSVIFRCLESSGSNLSRMYFLFRWNGIYQRVSFRTRLDCSHGFLTVLDYNSVQLKSFSLLF